MLLHLGPMAVFARIFVLPDHTIDTVVAVVRTGMQMMV
jgi:hypothetical protein